MDIRYDMALRNATRAWANNRTADALTMQELQRQRRDQRDPQQQQESDTPAATHRSSMQPELARYGSLGTRLNVFA